MYFIDKHSDLFDETIRIVIIGFQKGSGKWSEVREKWVKSQGILKWILSGNPVWEETDNRYYCIKRPAQACAGYLKSRLIQHNPFSRTLNAWLFDFTYTHYGAVTKIDVINSNMHRCEQVKAFLKPTDLSCFCKPSLYVQQKFKFSSNNMI